MWYDQSAADVTEAGMKDGVEKSAYLILFLRFGVCEVQTFQFTPPSPV